ncbi:MAG: hypothetical protein P8L85_15500 [Rubripirellula sp.]|nr:hypothetical protein [Rubripirellula sp.]
MKYCFVRVGSLGEVHGAESAVAIDRGQRVLVRTGRGVELAEVLGPRQSRKGHAAADAQPLHILRTTTPQDELLIERLQQHKQEAVEQCRQELLDSGSDAMLLEVDHLFDGGTLVLHFLGDIDKAAEAITQRVATRYESVVRTEDLAKLIDEGCGPSCGTEDGSGCGSSCAGCAARIVCHSK